MQDRVVGIVVALVGVYSISHGMTFSAEKGVMASAGALPILTGTFLLVLGGLLALTARQRPSGFVGAWKRLSCYGIMTALYIFGLSHLGFNIATPPYLIALLLLTGDRPVKARAYAGLGLAVIMTAGTYLLFDKMFRLLLP